MTLAELLVALAVLGMLLSATFGLLVQGQDAYAVGAARVEAQQSARIALVRLAGEIRTAGHGAHAFSAISVAERQRIVLHVDVDGDGRASGPTETITWRLAGRVLRRSAGGGAQPVINGVRDLAFEYLDAHGAPTVVPDLVRTVVVTLTTETDLPAAGPAAHARTTVSTRVRLRNR